MSSKPMPVECPNNEGVACTHPNRCGVCGWNPTVADERYLKILKEAGFAQLRKEVRDVVHL